MDVFGFVHITIAKTPLKKVQEPKICIQLLTLFFSVIYQVNQDARNSPKMANINF